MLTRGSDSFALWKTHLTHKSDECGQAEEVRISIISSGRRDLNPGPLKTNPAHKAKKIPRTQLNWLIVLARIKKSPISARLMPDRNFNAEISGI